jgi:hypothetical protein
MLRARVQARRHGYLDPMRKLEPLQLRAWTLPLIVFALIAPPTVAFLLAGPGPGLAVGAMVAAAVIVLAARAGFDEPIEVGGVPGDRYRLLAVALTAIESPTAAETVAEVTRTGAATTGMGEQEVLVLAPAINTPVAQWLSDVDRARFDAQLRLALSIGTLSAAGLEARGQVGDADPVQAVEDTLASFPAQELVFVTNPGAWDDELTEVRRRLDRPVRRVDD